MHFLLKGILGCLNHQAHSSPALPFAFFCFLKNTIGRKAIILKGMRVPVLFALVDGDWAGGSTQIAG
jgi:hypothetical protein